MRTPVTLITGVDPEAMAATMVTQLWDQPRAVAVRHHIDAERQVLVRLVSDVTGVVEHEEVDLAHACVSCAVREDIVPTLDRVARDGRWTSVLAHLPIGAGAEQVCAVCHLDPHLARRLRVTCVVAALDGETVLDDLLGDDLLDERGLATSPDDRRGVGEVAAAMVEYADVTVLSGPASATAVDLVRALARPDARVVTAGERFTVPAATHPLHDHATTRAWVDPQRTVTLEPPRSTLVWQLDLRSARALHPERLLKDLEAIGGGRHRSRGCFWLPTRPGTSLVWDGAGGQLSIGTGEPCLHGAPRTRIVVTGAGRPPGHLVQAFETMLVGVDELVRPGSWRAPEDGFEPWLGPIRGVA